MTHAKIPHNLTKFSGTPLYKGEAESEVFTKDLTVTSPEPHLLSHCEEKENFGQSLYGLDERNFATKPTKTFSQGRELFFLSIVAKTGIKGQVS